MRTLFIFLVTFLALISVTLAQEVTTSPVGAQIGTVKAGTTPDSFLWGLDVAIDNIRQLLTFDNTAKAKVGLEIARERLLEVREMVIENKIEASQKAQNEHVKTLEKVKASVTGLSRANSTQELEQEIELEREIEEHEEEVETVSEELKIKIEIKGVVTSEQQALIDSVLNLMQNKTGEVKIEIENKKGETKIKIKAETGKSEDEIEDEVEELEERTGLLDIKQTKAEEQIDDALEELAEVKSKLLEANVTNITSVNELVSQAEQKLAQAQDAFNETKFGEAFGLSNAAEQLAKNAEKILERFLEKEEEEEREIEVEVEGGVAKIKVEVNDLKLKYRLNTTNREEIIADIASKTGLSPDEINAIMEFEVEEEEEKEIEVEIEEGIAKVKTEIDGQKQKFVLSTTNQTEILENIANRTGLTFEEVKSLAEIEVEEEESEKEEAKGKSITKEESKKEESKSGGESKSGKSKED
ncbi:MAG: DUF5667 domain-containing protein [Candidatus Aenigmatarchaeota archaeon]